MARIQTLLVVSIVLALGCPDAHGEDAAASAAATPSFLEPSDRIAIDSALRWAGLTRADLGYSRDYVNYGLKEPVDRWRLPAAQRVLQEALHLPDLAAQWSLALSEDLGGAGSMPGWTGFHGIVGSQLGAAAADLCTDRATSQLGIIEQSLASEEAAGRKWSRREARQLRDAIDSRLDIAAGDLLGHAAVAKCRLDEAFSELTAKQRAEVVGILEQTLWGDPESIATEDEEERQFEILTAAWEATNRAALMAAGKGWSEALLAATLELSALPAEAWPNEPVILPSALGEIWIGSLDSNTGSGDPVLLLDPGGDDHWRIAPDRTELPQSGLRAVRGWIDLDGSDVWRGGQGGPGGALFSVAAGIDLRGDDIYRSDRLSQGAAAFGFSSWLDQGGRDRYLGTVAVQGFAAFGAAILRDAGKDGDLYQGGFLGQAAAHCSGVAVLHDGGGSDRYVLGGHFEDNPNRLSGHYSSMGQGFATGMRPYAGGGIAWILDESGHDHSLGGLWVKGSSYWHSLAALVDRAGNDRYSATQYSQGSGIHLSSAGLFDGGGDDRYLLPNLGQGSGHDLAVTWLIDAAGDDLYTGSNLLQGASITNSASFFIDRSGNDTYASRTNNSRGQTSNARGFGAVGMFIDGAGDDRYLDGKSSDVAAGLTEVRGQHGIFVDGLPAEAAPSEPEPEAPGQATTESETEANPATESVGARELLLNNVMYLSPSDDTDAAVARLAAGGKTVLTLLLPLTSGPKILRSYTIDRVIDRLIADSEGAQLVEVAEAIAQDARRLEQSSLDTRTTWHLRWLGKLVKAQPLTAEQGIEAVQSLREHPAWRVRKAAWALVEAIASRKDLELAEQDRQKWAVEASLALDGDAIIEVRAAAARALSAVGGPGIAPNLARALQEHSFELRDSAEQALLELTRTSDGIAVARAMFPIASGETGAPAPGRDIALRVLGSTGHRDAWAVLTEALADPDPVTRSAAIAGALLLRPRGLRSTLVGLLEVESEPTVRRRLEEALATPDLR